MVQYKSNRARNFKSPSHYTLGWFEITRPITPWITLHSVLLPLLTNIFMTIKKLKIHCGACCFWPKFKKFEATETYRFLITIYIARYNEVKLQKVCFIPDGINWKGKISFLSFFGFSSSYVCLSVCLYVLLLICTVCLIIVVWGDWLWKTTNIKYKNNSATVYVGGSLMVHNPLFSVGKLRRNK